MTKLTIYQRELARIVSERYEGRSAGEIVEQLCRIGVIDHPTCKTLVIRQWVEKHVRAGYGKVDAMWMATEHFCTTYEYIRKCLYYYTDVNI